MVCVCYRNASFVGLLYLCLSSNVISEPRISHKVMQYLMILKFLRNHALKICDFAAIRRYRDIKLLPFTLDDHSDVSILYTQCMHLYFLMNFT